MNRFQFAVLFVVVVVTGTCLSARPEDSKAADHDPARPYRAKRASPVTYNIDFRVVVTAPYHSKVLKVWLPLPQSDAGQEVVEKDIATFPLKVEPKIGKEKTFGNKFAYFEFKQPEGAQIIQHRFKVTSWELRWDVDPAKVTRVERWPDTFAPYLKSDATVVVDERLRKILGEVVPERRGAAQDLAGVFDWVNGHMKFDHAAASLRASSEHALEKRAGHCSDYHGLCSAFGRALGYPTRVTYGINPFPKNSPSHCKMEAYLPSYGWVSFDVSETQLLVAAINNNPDLAKEKKEELIKAARQRLREGFRDNTWFLQTRGTDYELVPPASKRVPVVRTIYAEADGVPLPDIDTADAKQRAFAWMTSHEYTADRAVSSPFRDWKSLVPAP